MSQFLHDISGAVQGLSAETHLLRVRCALNDVQYSEMLSGLDYESALLHSGAITRCNVCSAT